MGASVSSGSQPWSSTDVQSIILKAGSLMALSPGQTIIRQGEQEPSLFFILNGELVIQHSSADGKRTKEIGRRGRNEVIGEISFLLNTPPAASVSVPLDYSRDVTVVEVKRSRIAQLLHRDPKFAGQVFNLLAVALSHRIAMSSQDRIGAVQSVTAETDSAGMLAPEELGTHGPDGGDAAVEPKRFGLADAFAKRILHTPCSVVIEREGAWGDQPCPALLAVFSSAVCLELHALNLVSHRVVPFADVLGCEQVDSPTQARPVLLISCRGTTLLCGLEPAILPYVHSVIEQRRLATAADDAIDSEWSEVSLRELSAEQRELRDTQVKRAYDELYLKQFVSMDEGSEHAGERASHVATAPAAPSASAKKVDLIEEQLTAEEWAALMRGAEHFRFQKGQLIIREGERLRALYQLVSGSAHVEMRIKGRPQALVVARKKPGDLFGERSLLLSGHAKASVVVCSESASVIRLKHGYLKRMLATSQALVSAKFFYFLALDQARRLHLLTQADRLHEDETVTVEKFGAPTRVEDIVANRAYLSILHKHVVAMEKRMQKAKLERSSISSRTASARNLLSSLSRTSRLTSSRVTSSSRNLLSSLSSKRLPGTPAAKPRTTSDSIAGDARRAVEFLVEYDPLQDAPNASVMRLGQRLVSQFIKAQGSKQLRIVTKRQRLECEGAIKAIAFALKENQYASASFGGSAGAEDEETVPYHMMRTALANVAHLCRRFVELNCMQAFLLSAEYEYILALKKKGETTCTAGDFKPVRLLSEGPQPGRKTLEVMKRDCGKRYALQVHSLAALEEAAGGNLVARMKHVRALQQMRTLQTSLRHPLVQTIAYAFHSPTELSIVLAPLCEASLRDYLDADDALSPAQSLYVCAKLVSAIEHLHKHFVLHRDLRAEHVLVDANGQLRLTGFEHAIQGQTALPDSSEAVGALAYRAPEAFACACSATPSTAIGKETTNMTAGLGGSSAPPAFAYGASADWWAFGVVVHEMSERKLPFGDKPTLETLFQEHAAMMAPLRRGRQGAQLLVLALLGEWSVSKRLGATGGASEVKDFSYFRDIDWSTTGHGDTSPSPLKSFRIWKDIQKRKAEATKQRRASIDRRVDALVPELSFFVPEAPTQPDRPAQPAQPAKAIANFGAYLGAPFAGSDGQGAKSKVAAPKDTPKSSTAATSSAEELRKILEEFDYVSEYVLVEEFMETMAAKTSFL